MPRLDHAGTTNSLIEILLTLCLSACASGAPAATPTLVPTPQPPTSTPSGECLSAEPGPVAQTSVLVPGPSAGVPASIAVGDRLVIVVTILDSTCAPVVGASVNIHHTDAAGIYGPGHGTA